MRRKKNLFLEQHCACSVVNWACVCVCVCRKVTRHLPLGRWAVGIVSTGARKKTKVSVHSDDADEFDSRTSHACFRPLQWWMRSTTSFWSKSLLTKASRPERSASSGPLPLRCRSPPTRTRSRWPRGSMQKASRNRKFTTPGPEYLLTPHRHTLSTAQKKKKTLSVLQVYSRTYWQSALLHVINKSGKESSQVVTM